MTTHQRARLLVFWAIAGFVFPLSILILRDTFWRTHPPSFEEVATLKETSRSPDFLRRVADGIAVAHLVATVGIGCVTVRPRLRLPFLAIAAVQLFFTADVWFGAQMALSGYWL
ncbi:MAG TPA: hypothetical protein VGJ05_03480 [Fimbriiglobus sp.]